MSARSTQYDEVVQACSGAWGALMLAASTQDASYELWRDAMLLWSEAGTYLIEATMDDPRRPSLLGEAWQS